MTAEEQAVQNGIAWLNENVPGWLEKIDVDTLDIGSCENCILGQLYGHYCRHPVSLCDPCLRRDLGFTTEIGDFEGLDRLTDAWRRTLIPMKMATTQARPELA